MRILELITERFGNSDIGSLEPTKEEMLQVIITLKRENRLLKNTLRKHNLPIASLIDEDDLDRLACGNVDI